MIPDRDIYQIALVMLRKHGVMAATYAEMEAEKLLDEGDEDRFQTWLRILMAMDELRSIRPPRGATIH